MSRRLAALGAIALLALTGCAGQPAAAPVTITETAPAATTSAAPTTSAPTKEAESSTSAPQNPVAAKFDAQERAEALGLTCKYEATTEGSYATPTEVTTVCNDSKVNRNSDGDKVDDLVIITSDDVEQSMGLLEIMQDPDELLLIGDSIFISGDAKLLASLQE